MIKDIKISVIMPTFNHAQFIGESIQSVLSQTYQNWELIIIDNYSEDNTTEVVASFSDSRIHYLKFRNKGIIASSRNEGIREATGEYIAFLDSDDYWEPAKLEYQLNHFDSDAMIGIGCASIRTGDLTYHHEANINTDNELLNIDALFSKYSLPLSSLMVKSTGLLFDESKKFKYVEDFEFQVRLINESGKGLYLLGQPLIYYRIHSLSGSSTNYKDQNALNVAIKYKHIIPSDSYREFMKRIYFTYGVSALRSHSNKSRGLFLTSLSYASWFQILKPLAGFILSIIPVMVRKFAFGFYYKISRVRDPQN